MAIVPEVLSTTTLSELRENYSDAEIREMSISEAFDKWLDYNGIIGYGSLIRRTLLDIITSDAQVLSTLSAEEFDKLATLFGLQANSGVPPSAHPHTIQTHTDVSGGYKSKYTVLFCATDRPTAVKPIAASNIKQALSKAQHDYIPEYTACQWMQIINESGTVVYDSRDAIGTHR